MAISFPGSLPKIIQWTKVKDYVTRKQNEVIGYWVVPGRFQTDWKGAQNGKKIFRMGKPLSRKVN